MIKQPSYFFSFFIVSLNIINCIAQAPLIQWQKSFGGTSIENCRSVKQTSDGGFIIAGSTKSNNGDVIGNHGTGTFDYWILKLNSSGIVAWKKTYGGSKDDEPKSIIQTIDGGYILAGSTRSNDDDVTFNHGLDDCWILKLDTSGNIQWQKSFGGSSVDRAYSIIQTFDGGYAFVGETGSVDGDIIPSYGNVDYWIVKLDSAGGKQWVRSYGGYGVDVGRSLAQTIDSGYIITGYTFSSDGDVSGYHGMGDFWTIKLTSNGNLSWQKVLGGAGDDRATVVIDDLDGSYIIAGQTESNGTGDVVNNNGMQDFWIVKLNFAGTQILWKKCFGGNNSDYLTSIIQTSDSGYIAIGTSYSSDGNVSANYGDGDYWVLKISKFGSIEWQKNYGGPDFDVPYQIERCTNGGFIVGGSTNSVGNDVNSNHGLADYWIVKLSDPIGIMENSTSKTEFKLYPNPAVNFSHLVLSKSTKMKSILQISNSFGRIIYEREIQFMGQDLTEFLINTSDYPDGLYFIYLKCGDNISVRKLVISAKTGSN